MDLLYRIATGWLRWSPRDAWHTPIPEILLAKEGLFEWTKASNPFGSSKAGPAEDPASDKPQSASDDALLAAFGKFGMIVVDE